MTDDVFVNDSTNPVETLVGEGKKFKTVEDLARGKLEADQFIDRLKTEMEELRKELGKSANSDATLAELRKEVEELRHAKEQPSRDNTNPALTQDGIRALIEQTITRTEQNRTAQQNIQAANDAVLTHYGDRAKAAEAVQAKAVELGLSIDTLKDIAAKSPAAFQKIMLGDAAPADTGPLAPKSAVNVNASSSQGGTPKPGSYEYYENIRKTNRQEYFSPRVQEAIFKAIKAGTYQRNDV